MSLTTLIRKLFAEPAAAPAVRDVNLERRWISNPWHSVSVVPCGRPCAAAQEAAGTRYLSSDAPVLPLAGCTSRKCECRYRHHDDRRHEPRRAADIWTAGRVWAGQERRAAPGRRSGDH